jgi:hypothetical protein
MLLPLRAIFEEYLRARASYLLPAARSNRKEVSVDSPEQRGGPMTSLSSELRAAGYEEEVEEVRTGAAGRSHTPVSWKAVVRRKTVCLSIRA